MGLDFTDFKGNHI